MKAIPGKAVFIMVFVLMAPLVLSGCGRGYDPDKTVARINNYYMSIDDFKSDLGTVYVNEQGVLSDEEVLELAIRREVLVQEAQKHGLDREKTFMKTIERYWKQTLIKELLDRKSREISQKQGLSDAEKNKMMQDWYSGLYKRARINKYTRVLKEAK